MHMKINWLRKVGKSVDGELAKLGSIAIPVFFTVEQITPQISGLKQSCITHQKFCWSGFWKKPTGAGLYLLHNDDDLG